jgi:hypothetical protein
MTTNETTTNDVIVIDLCSDSGDEKPKTASTGPSVAKKRRLQTDAAADDGWEVFPAVDDTTCAVAKASRVSSDSSQNPSPQAARQQKADQEPLIFFSGQDSVTVTEGIPKFLCNFRQTPEVVTCMGRQVSKPPPPCSLRHIQQSDKWSCGYRNLQMMLTALVPILPPHHPYFQGKQEQVGAFCIHSAREIQELLETLWAAGWDSSGAQHYKRKIVGKPSKIGAVEVSSVLSFQGIDNTIVQFIKCAESRQQLGPFCWAYFHRLAGCPLCQAGTVSSMAVAQQLLSHPATVDHSKVASTMAEGSAVSCQCSLPPLYLQWEGHSVTVVGVERRTPTVAGTDLLVLDPMQDGSRLSLALSQCDLAPARLPCKRMQGKDCQIILYTTGFLTTFEKTDRKERVCAATAAQEAVMKVVPR